MKWTKFLDATGTMACRPLLREALPFVSGSVALDLGAGALRDSLFLLDHGFTVTAVDSNPEVTQYAPDNADFELHICSYSEFAFPTSNYDLVSAQYALPFESPEEFSVIFSKIIASLKAGGIFTGQLFGSDDGWASREDMTFHTKEQVEELLHPFTTIHVLREEKRLGPTASGEEKMWHVFHIIAEK